MVPDRSQTLVGPSWDSHQALFSSVEQNEMEATKAAALHSPAMNSTKSDSTAAAAPASASMDDGELKKVLEKCKRQQAELDKLAEENRQLKVRHVCGATTAQVPQQAALFCVAHLGPSSASSPG